MNSMKSFSSLQKAHGSIPYNMTNDYMFRAVLQTNNNVLRGLIRSLLHLSEEELVSAEIVNPITLGQSVISKEFRLDINVRLNNHTHLNLEMQIAKKKFWQNRSIVYLCRSFDHLNHGQDYKQIHPVIHIGFLDYALFEENAEFYATYKLLNTKNYHVYSDNFTLSVVDLSHIDLASEEDKEYHIDYWAKLFKATTWEEIKMLASKDQYINEASNTIFQLSADDLIRKQCQDREEYYLDLQSYEQDLQDCREEIAEREAELAAVKTKLDSAKTELDSTITELDSAKTELAQKDIIIEKTLAEAEYLRSLLKKHGITGVE